MSKRVKRNSIEKYNEHFSEFISNTKKREENNALYDNIYKYYKARMNDKDFDAKIERITLNQMLGNYRGFKSNADIQYLLIIMTLFITSSIQYFSSTFPEKYSTLIFYISSAGLLLYIIRDIKKAGSSEKEFVYNLSLKVLDDIEKEYKTK